MRVDLTGASGLAVAGLAGWGGASSERWQGSV